MSRQFSHLGQFEPEGGAYSQFHVWVASRKFQIPGTGGAIMDKAKIFRTPD